MKKLIYTPLKKKEFNNIDIKLDYIIEAQKRKDEHDKKKDRNKTILLIFILIMSVLGIYTGKAKFEVILELLTSLLGLM